MKIARLVGGTAFLLLFVYLAAQLFHLTGGVFLSPHWVAFYVLVALVTGGFFWTFTDSTGDFSWKELGIKLGGGAAIGMSFMVAAQYFTPTIAFPYRVVTVGQPIQPSAVFFKEDAPAEFHVLGSPGRRILVEFREGQQAVRLSVNVLDGPDLKTETYTVPRVGEIPSPEISSSGS